MCANLRRATRAVTQLYDDALRETGLRVTQFTLLQVLQRTGSMMQSELADALALDSTTLTRSLRPLIEAHLIAAAAGRDRRERHLALTARGRRRLDDVQPAWERAQKRLRSALEGTAWESLMRDLHGLAATAR
jgi:DNA-binding MarR family transcriptional regulator